MAGVTGWWDRLTASCWGVDFRDLVMEAARCAWLESGGRCGCSVRYVRTGWRACQLFDPLRKRSDGRGWLLGGGGVDTRLKSILPCQIIRLGKRQVGRARP